MKRFNANEKNIKTIIELNSKGVSYETISEIIGASTGTIRFYANAHNACINGNIDELKRIAKSSSNPKGVQRVCKICGISADFLDETESPKEEQLSIVEETITDPVLYELKQINSKMAVLISLMQRMSKDG